MSTSWLAVGIIVISTLLSGLESILLKRGSKRFTINPRTIFTHPSTVFLNYPLLIGVMLSIFCVCLNIIALRYGELSVLIPITSLNYVWTCIFARIFLKESITPRKSLGIVFIIMGVVLVRTGGVT